MKFGHQCLLLEFQKAKTKDWMALLDGAVQQEGPESNSQLRTIIKVPKALINYNIFDKHCGPRAQNFKHIIVFILWNPWRSYVIDRNNEARDTYVSSSNLYSRKVKMPRFMFRKYDLKGLGFCGHVKCTLIKRSSLIIRYIYHCRRLLCFSV